MVIRYLGDNFRMAEEVGERGLPGLASEHVNGVGVTLVFCSEEHHPIRTKVVAPHDRYRQDRFNTPFVVEGSVVDGKGEYLAVEEIVAVG